MQNRAMRGYSARRGCTIVLQVRDEARDTEVPVLVPRHLIAAVHSGYDSVWLSLRIKAE